MTEAEAQAQLDSEIKAIKELEKSSLDNFIAIGAHLHSLKTSTLYQHIRTPQGKLGYNSVYDLLKEYFGYDKSTVSRYIGVAQRFGNNFNGINKRFADYSFTQLVEMLPLTDVQIAKCLPTMTCAEIRAFKKLDEPTTDEKEYKGNPDTSIQITMDEKLYNQLLTLAKKQKKRMDKFLVEVLELYISTIE